MLMKPTESITDELLNSIPNTITFQEFVTNVFPVYPTLLSNLTIVKKENKVELLNFSFNPPIIPIEILIQQALNDTNIKNLQTLVNNANDIYLPNKKNILIDFITNTFYTNQEAIEAESGLTVEELLAKQCDDIRKKKKENSILLTDNQGNVEGDTIEVVMDI